MSSFVRTTALVVALTALSKLGLAHISLDVPKSRYYQSTSSQADQNRLKSGPCGVSGDSRTTNSALVTTYKPGETITVSWRETVQHPGHYRIAFDSNGQDFPLPGVEPPSGVVILADDIADKSGSSNLSYTQQVTLPDLECDHCTLQLVQVMVTSPPPYAAGDVYYNCADLVLKASSGTAGGSGTAAGGSSVGGQRGSSGGNGGSSNGGFARGGLSSMAASSGGTSAGRTGSGGTSGNDPGGTLGNSSLQAAGGDRLASGGSSGRTSSGIATATGGGSSLGQGGTRESTSATAIGGTPTHSTSSVMSESGGSPNSTSSSRTSTPSATGGSSDTNRTESSGIVTPNNSSDSGCSCRLGRSEGSLSSVSGILMAMALVGRRRRRN